MGATESGALTGMVGDASTIDSLKASVSYWRDLAHANGNAADKLREEVAQLKGVIRLLNEACKSAEPDTRRLQHLIEGNGALALCYWSEDNGEWFVPLNSGERMRGNIDADIDAVARGVAR